MISRPSRSPRPVHGRSRAPRAAGVIRSASSSPSRSRNSQRYRSPVTCMKVAARAGSQICSTPSQVSRPVSALMSTTSQRSVKPRSSMVIPASCRIVLLAPSQPSTTRPVNVCGSPATRACTRTGAAVSGPRVAVQPGHLGAAAEADQRVPLDPGEHQLFQVGLVEHVRLREAVLAGLVARGGTRPSRGGWRPAGAVRCRAGTGPGSPRSRRSGPGSGRPRRPGAPRGAAGGVAGSVPAG